MVLIGGGIVLLLLAVAALLPSGRAPTWLRVYIGVAIACVILVVLTVLIT